jgi:hypothetical protein
VEVGEDEAFESFEGAAVFLAEPGVAEGAAILVEEFGGDARAEGGGNLYSKPI